MKALQEAQEKQRLLIKQKLEQENKLHNTEKDLKKVRMWSSINIKVKILLTALYKVFIVLVGRMLRWILLSMNSIVNIKILPTGPHTFLLVLVGRIWWCTTTWIKLANIPTRGWYDLHFTPKRHHLTDMTEFFVISSRATLKDTMTPYNGDQNPWFTPLRETARVPNLCTRESPPPSHPPGVSLVSYILL